MEKIKKKILYVHHSGNFGGAPKSMSYIIKNIDRNKYEPILLNIAEGPINNFFKKELNCKLIVAKFAHPFHGSTVAKHTNKAKAIKVFIWQLLLLLPTIITAYKYIKKIKPDLIHLNSTCLFAFSFVAKLLGVKTICHVREPILGGFLGFPLRYVNNKCVDGYIAISNYDLKSLNNIPDNIKKKVIYNFVDKFYIKDNEFIDTVRPSLGISKDDVVFLYLARFANSNGWQELVNMGKKLANKNIHFVLLGAMKEQDFQYADKNIHILSFSTDIDIYLKSADVFVCPFVEPHFARGVIEASAYSLPCIGNNIGGVNELILHDKTGYLYNTENEFIKYCEKLANAYQIRNELGKNAYNFAQEKFNIKNNLIETYQFYRQFI